MIISKFGGTSVADAAAIERTAEIVRGRLARRPIVVVSALAGVTNALLAVARQASEGNFISAVSSVQALRERHLAEVDALLATSDEHAELSAEISVIFDELASLCEALSVLGFITPRSLDAIAGMGERASSMLVAAAFRARGMDAVHVDARKVMITDGNYGKAEPQPDAIAHAARSIVAPLVHAGRVPVMGGYIGSSVDGITTTLGRGGSDYSASLIGAGLQAESIEIWTDVDGMLTADPRVVPTARPIEQIRFDEASELASFGAKVLHPATIAPAVRLGIPVWIYNSRNPGAHGTRITFDAPRRAVTAIAAKRDTTILRIESAKMLFQHGFLRRVFELFDEHSVSVDVVATSEVSVSVTVDDSAPLDVLLGALRQIGDVSVGRRRAIVSVVGSGIADDADAMGTVLRALGSRRIYMLSLSASAINLTILLDDADVPDAMRALHAALFERVGA
ncbi:MAG: lysine-sensitive aspartokinase 3 [Gemmatimonadaceae bacterium]|nr:lysine-sensitive aspartokinase 3 [Gemmatimonadaceae bacterium]